MAADRKVTETTLQIFWELVEEASTFYDLVLAPEVLVDKITSQSRLDRNVIDVCLSARVDRAPVEVCSSIDGSLAESERTFAAPLETLLLRYAKELQATADRQLFAHVEMVFTEWPGR